MNFYKFLISMFFVFVSSLSMANEYKLFMTNPVGSGADQVGRKLVQLVKDQSNITISVHNVGNFINTVQQYKQEKLAVIFPTTSILVYGPLNPNTQTAQHYTRQDFNIISNLGLTGKVWFTYPGSGIDTAEDLIKVLPNIPKASIGVSDQVGMMTGQVFVASRKMDVPVVMYKNHNETAIAVAGKHNTVGIAILGTDSIYALAEQGSIKILGYSGDVPTSYKNNRLNPISRTLRMPNFYAGSWLAITPGDTEEHRRLRAALLQAMQDKELQALIRQTWPLGGAVPFDTVFDTAVKYREYIR